MSYQQHESSAQTITPRCAVVILSDSRTEENDTSGQTIVRLLTEAGAMIQDRKIIRDEPAELQTLLDEWLGRDDIDVVLTSGGTGISSRDSSIDVVEAIIEIPLPGFGELFRMLSWEQIGSGAMLSRAAGGVARYKLLFAMPGSPAAVELAMSRLVIPGMKHLLREVRR